MTSTVNIQDRYRCYTCKSASDIYGRGCKHGMMYPVLLLMANQGRCDKYEFDPVKVQAKQVEIEKQAREK